MAERKTKKESTVDNPQETVDSGQNENEEPEAENIYIGQCKGGPMDGQQGESRFPKGFVLIDRPNSAAWVYDYDPETSVFTAREQDIHDNMRALKAAEESNYDVRALDRGIPGLVISE